MSAHRFRWSIRVTVISRLYLMSICYSLVILISLLLVDPLWSARGNRIAILARFNFVVGENLHEGWPDCVGNTRNVFLFLFSRLTDLAERKWPTTCSILKSDNPRAVTYEKYTQFSDLIWLLHGWGAWMAEKVRTYHLHGALTGS